MECFLTSSEWGCSEGLSEGVLGWRGGMRRRRQYPHNEIHGKLIFVWSLSAPLPSFRPYNRQQAFQRLFAISP